MTTQSPLKHMSGRLLAAVLLATGALAAQAAAYPDKPIHFIVPYAAGGTTDLVARVVGERVAARLGKPVVVENRPGAGGNIGMDAVAKSAPDGYTLGMGAISTNALNPHIYKSMAFDPRKDFTAISLLGTSTIVLQVVPAMPARNVAELVEQLKKAPGSTYGTAGVGTSMHLAGVLFAQSTGTSLTHVPYKGSAPGINDMLGGHLPMMFDNLPASLAHIQAGKLRALAVTGKTRSASLPNVPTMAEAGVPDYVVEPWFGVYGPAGMPADVVQAVSRAYSDALAMPEVKEKLLQAGFSPRGSSPQELTELGRAEYERLGKVARSAGMLAE
ncbi:Bug family tripartite tricarboxylate transporter substrate binding protein [Noviherbaspirillum suwonense]|uniref:Tripartite-type tricarboxylate transporter, receptor component TctC n=1 Tax=Noviherbaspirillum suwonense TaxID=1224511 RepID=A0ABY1Q632_9BURK|nr:Tripartite-type tricarboxylate transporter, receptor component TctC [Noviherbaspirillum suwonense]